MTLRLTDDEADALRRRAETEGRSMQDVARQAVRDYVETNSRLGPAQPGTRRRVAEVRRGAGATRAVIYLTLPELMIVAERTLGQVEVRDIGLLESAVARPMASAFGEDAYPSIDHKAAALVHLDRTEPRPGRRQQEAGAGRPHRFLRHERSTTHLHQRPGVRLHPGDRGGGAGRGRSHRRRPRGGHRTPLNARD